MRKIEQDMLRAIVNKSDYSCDNTRVSVIGGVVNVYLYDHHIAIISADSVKLNNCGYSTKTTKSRLNCILDKFIVGRQIYQKDFGWYLTGEPIADNSCAFPHDVWVSFSLTDRACDSIVAA